MPASFDLSSVSPEGATMAVGTIAKPSSPSVKLTALLVPTITKYVSGKNSKPSGNATSLKNGTIRVVSAGSSAL